MKGTSFVIAFVLGAGATSVAVTAENNQPGELSSRLPPSSLVSTSVSRAATGSRDTAIREKAETRATKRSATAASLAATQDRHSLHEGLQREHRLRAVQAGLVSIDRDAKRTALNGIVARDEKSGIEVRVSKQSGAVTFIRKGQTSPVQAASPDADSETSALNKFLAENAALFNLQDAGKQLALTKRRSDKQNKRHYLYQQTVNGVPVHGGQVLAHFDAAGELYAMTSRTRAVPLAFDTTPDVSVAKATEITRQRLGHVGQADVSPRLEIHSNNDRPRLVYAVTSLVDNVNRWKTVIDAKTGRVVQHFVDHQEGKVAASGTDLLGKKRNFTAWGAGGMNYMIDVSTPYDSGTEDPVNVASPYGDTAILDLANTEGSAVYHVTSGSVSSGWDPAAVSAMHNVQGAYRYFLDTHGRAGIDGNNGNLFAYIHLGVNVDNAFWNGNAMVLGDGGSVFSNLAACYDVVGHEMAHGVIASTANLIYQNQSGALNESFADFFGAMVEGGDWILGEDCTVASPGFLRSMSNPHQGLSSQPAHMSEFAYLPNTADGDHGGVHVNSGIPNRAAYLLTEGLTNEGLGSSIGRAAAEALYYHTLNTYLVSSSQFIDLRRGMLLSAADLYPGDSSIGSAVEAAFDAVGITEGNVGTPNDSAPTEAEVLAGDDLLLYLYPVDGTYDGGDTFEFWMQVLDAPFSGYNPAEDHGPLNNGETIGTRPAAFTDEYGTVALYVGSDFNLYWNVGGSITQLTTGGWIWSISTTDDGRRIAYTLNDATDNGIYVYDPTEDVETRYELGMVDYQRDAPESGSRILYADALDFNYLGNRIAFDAFVCIPTADASCTDSDPFGYWTIGVLDLNTGTTHYPFANQDAEFDVGYPTFAQNNEYVIAFDMVEYLGGGGIVTATFTFNTETNEFPGLGVNRGVSVPGPEMWGVPTFLGNDEALVLQALLDGDDGTGYVRVSTVKLDLNGDFSIKTGSGVRMNHFDAGFPQIHRAVYRDLKNVKLTPSTTMVDFGDVETDADSEFAFTLTNNSAADVVIYQASIDNNAFSHNIANTRVPRGQSIEGKIYFSSGSTTGTRVGNFQIITDGSDSTIDVTLAATVVADTDDDDGDGGSGGGSGGGSDTGGGGGGGIFLWVALALIPLRRIKLLR